MTYMIDARLEQGVPTLVLTDAVTGEERLHWRSDGATSGERGWQGLFKRLVLLACTDRLSLVQRTKSPAFGGECIRCSTCVDQNTVMETQKLIFSARTKDNDV